MTNQNTLHWDINLEKVDYIIRILKCKQLSYEFFTKKFKLIQLKIYLKEKVSLFNNKQNRMYFIL